MQPRYLVAATFAAGVCAAVAAIGAPLADKDKTVEVQILGINDFHGNLAPPEGFSGKVGDVDAGGAEYLATRIAELRRANPERTFVVSAGDLIGASPLLSGLFHDEPTIEAMNDIGLDVNAVGNHEFDEGVNELMRMQKGGCHPSEGCVDGDGFAGARFTFLAANVVREDDGSTLFPPYVIRQAGGARIAFVGMTLKGTPSIVSAAGIKGYDFRDEADTVNALVPELKHQRVDAIVVLIHEGGLPASQDINGCNGVSGPIVDIVSHLDPAVNLVLSGHTHQPYNCTINGIPTTSAFSYGRLVTDIDLVLDSHGVHSISINNRIVTPDVPRDEHITALINRYTAAAAPIANRAIGRITGDLIRAPDLGGEQSLGNAISDAQLFATRDTGAEIAFMNPGGVRADLLYAPDGVVTYGELFSVQPFGNGLLTMDLTAAQLEQLLEQQFCGVNSPTNGGSARVLSPSAGFAYRYARNAAGTADCSTADAVDPASITLNGAPLDPNRTYRVTVNTFLADGGDGFTVFGAGTNRTGGPVDTDAFERYLELAGEAGLAPPATDRVTAAP